MKYPIYKKEEYEETYFGHRLHDPYRGLKDAKASEVLAWVKAENEYTDQWFDSRELTQKIEELKRRKMKPLYQNIGAWGDRLTAVVVEDGDYKAVSVDWQFGDERLIMKRGDIPSYMPCELKACPVNQNFIAVLGLIDGDSRLTAMVIDCEKKKILNQFGNVFSICWSKSREIIYYAATDTNVEAQTTTTNVYAYDVKDDMTRKIFACDENIIIGETYAGSDQNHIAFVMLKDYSRSWIYLYAEDTGKITCVNSRPSQIKYVDSKDGKHYFISKETSPNGELLAVPENSDISRVEVAVPEKEKVLENGFLSGDGVYLIYMNQVCSELVCLKNGKEKLIELPSNMGTVEYTGCTEDTVYLKFESFLDKPMLLALEGEKVIPVLRNSKEVHLDLVVEQKTAVSIGDKKEIPYFVVHRKDIELNGKNAAWIYAYGGYNISMRPSAFELVTNLDIADWVEKGGIYVLASIRGGNEFGMKWHEEGMLMKKKNCYYDFIGVTEQLIAEGWTNPSKIVISGCSNGGLLMSALVTMRPELFRCVIDSVPHTDMIGFAEDDRGPMYITEYGNPKESREMFEYLLSYSPYHNIRETEYPCIYIQTGECDNNVPPYHGKKFAAKLQEMNRSENPILLRVLADGAHDRGAGDVYYQTISEMQLFVEKSLGN